jgi:hypothetical protein
MRFRILVPTLLTLFAASSARADDKKPPLRVAILTPAFGIRDNKAGYEALPKWLEANYRVEVTLIVPADRKTIPDLEKAAEADVVLTGLTRGTRREAVRSGAQTLRFEAARGHASQPSRRGFQGAQGFRR